MRADEILLSDSFQKCVEFHGHLCPGLAIGFQAARLLMERLGAKRSPDEELVAVVETDACGADAIQVVTGCTFGKGNFIFQNYGKHAFSLIDRKKGRGLRACLKAEGMPSSSEQLALFERIRNDRATPEERERFKEIQQERIRTILEASPDSLFKIEERRGEIPPKATIVESRPCDLCGELTKIDLLQDARGRKVCKACLRSPG